MDITALQDLLKNNKNDDEEPEEQCNQMTPASFGFQPPVVEKKKEIKPMSKNDIWGEAEIPTLAEVEDKHAIKETRPRPESTILFKQHVGSEDVYLGMGDTSPATQHCSHMVVKIKFPGHKMKDLDLDVRKQKIIVQSSKYFLNLYLPYESDHEKGKAKFETDTCTLIITLPIIRGLPF